MGFQQFERVLAAQLDVFFFLVFIISLPTFVLFSPKPEGKKRRLVSRKHETIKVKSNQVIWKVFDDKTLDYLAGPSRTSELDRMAEASSIQLALTREKGDCVYKC